MKYTSNVKEDEVIKEIEKRSENPESFEKYNSRRKRKNTYYRIYIKNYTIFYVVKNNTMEIRRILYSRRNNIINYAIAVFFLLLWHDIA